MRTALCEQLPIRLRVCLHRQTCAPTSDDPCHCRRDPPLPRSDTADQTSVGFLLRENPRTECSRLLPDTMQSICSLNSKADLFWKWLCPWPMAHNEQPSFMQLLDNPRNQPPDSFYSLKVWAWKFRQNYINACALVAGVLFKLGRPGCLR